jgi:hypothetical protein
MRQAAYQKTRNPTKPQRNTCYDAAKEIASPGEPSAAISNI